MFSIKSEEKVDLGVKSEVLVIAYNRPCAKILIKLIKDIKSTG